MKGMWDRMKYLDSRLAKADREGLAGQWPGWDDIYDILQMGRFVNMHFIVCSQDFRDDIFGGRGGRNYLGFKGMAGFNPGQWDKFMQTKPVPTMQNHVGRWMFSDGSPDSDTWVQVLFADAEHDRAAYEYAAEGRAAFLDNDGDTLVITDSDDDAEEDAALATDGKSTPLSSYLSKIGAKSVSQTDDATDGDDRRIIRGWQGAADYFGWSYRHSTRPGGGCRSRTSSSRAGRHAGTKTTYWRGRRRGPGARTGTCTPWATTTGGRRITTALPSQARA